MDLLWASVPDFLKGPEHFSASWVGTFLKKQKGAKLIINTRKDHFCNQEGRQKIQT